MASGNDASLFKTEVLLRSWSRTSDNDMINEVKLQDSTPDGRVRSTDLVFLGILVFRKMRCDGNGFAKRSLDSSPTAV
jgi:hypothetical protein